MASDTYKWLARYYDHLFEFRRPFDEAWKAVIAPVLPGLASACDLGCGTGVTALKYARRGMKTYAVDLSPEMCRITRMKSRRAAQPLGVICADMRDFKLPEPVDIITCLFDAVNHIPRKPDLKRVARAAAANLNPGGWFIFDVNNQLAFERVWRLTWWLEKDPVVMVMRSSHKQGTHRAAADVEWFIRSGANTWRRHHEHVEEICWTPQEVRAALSSAGFGSIRQFDAAPFFDDALTQPGNRTFWRARKK